MPKLSNNTHIRLVGVGAAGSNNKYNTQNAANARKRTRTNFDDEEEEEEEERRVEDDETAPPSVVGSSGVMSMVGAFNNNAYEGGHDHAGPGSMMMTSYSSMSSIKPPMQQQQHHSSKATMMKPSSSMQPKTTTASSSSSSTLPSATNGRKKNYTNNSSNNNNNNNHTSSIIGNSVNAASYPLSQPSSTSSVGHHHHQQQQQQHYIPMQQQQQYPLHPRQQQQQQQQHNIASFDMYDTVGNNMNSLNIPLHPHPEQNIGYHYNNNNNNNTLQVSSHTMGAGGKKKNTTVAGSTATTGTSSIYPRSLVNVPSTNSAVISSSSNSSNNNNQHQRKRSPFTNSDAAAAMRGSSSSSSSSVGTNSGAQLMMMQKKTNPASYHGYTTTTTTTTTTTSATSDNNQYNRVPLMVPHLRGPSGGVYIEASSSNASMTTTRRKPRKQTFPAMNIARHHVATASSLLPYLFEKEEEEGAEQEQEEMQMMTSGIPTATTVRNSKRKNNQRKTPNVLSRVVVGNVDGTTGPRVPQHVQSLIHIAAHKTARAFVTNPLFKRWTMCEFLYSGIDRGYFLRNDFVELLAELNLAHVTRLTRIEWGVIRSTFLSTATASAAAAAGPTTLASASWRRNLRTTSNFFARERMKLERYRSDVRRVHLNLVPTVSSLIDGPFVYQCPKPYIVGQHVSALHPVHRELCTGQITAANIMYGNYAVQFDRVGDAAVGGVGGDDTEYEHIVPDTEIYPHGDIDLLYPALTSLPISKHYREGHAAWREKEEEENGNQAKKTSKKGGTSTPNRKNNTVGDKFGVDASGHVVEQNGEDEEEEPAHFIPHDPWRLGDIAGPSNLLQFCLASNVAVAASADDDDDDDDDAYVASLMTESGKETLKEQVAIAAPANPTTTFTAMDSVEAILDSARLALSTTPSSLSSANTDGVSTAQQEARKLMKSLALYNQLGYSQLNSTSSSAAAAAAAAATGATSQQRHHFPSIGQPVRVSIADDGDLILRTFSDFINVTPAAATAAAAAIAGGNKRKAASLKKSTPLVNMEGSSSASSSSSSSTEGSMIAKNFIDTENEAAAESSSSSIATNIITKEYPAATTTSTTATTTTGNKNLSSNTNDDNNMIPSSASIVSATTTTSTSRPHLTGSRPTTTTNNNNNNTDVSSSSTSSLTSRRNNYSASSGNYQEWHMSTADHAAVQALPLLPIMHSHPKGGSGATDHNQSISLPAGGPAVAAHLVSLSAHCASETTVCFAEILDIESELQQLVKQKEEVFDGITIVLKTAIKRVQQPQQQQQDMLSPAKRVAENANGVVSSIVGAVNLARASRRSSSISIIAPSHTSSTASAPYPANDEKIGGDGHDAATATPSTTDTVHDVTIISESSNIKASNSSNSSNINSNSNSSSSSSSNNNSSSNNDRPTELAALEQRMALLNTSIDNHTKALGKLARARALAAEGSDAAAVASGLLSNNDNDNNNSSNSSNPSSTIVSAPNNVGRNNNNNTRAPSSSTSSSSSSSSSSSGLRIDSPFAGAVSACSSALATDLTATSAAAAILHTQGAEHLDGLRIRCSKKATKLTAVATRDALLETIITTTGATSNGKSTAAATTASTTTTTTTSTTPDRSPTTLIKQCAEDAATALLSLEASQGIRNALQVLFTLQSVSRTTGGTPLSATTPSSSATTEQLLARSIGSGGGAFSPIEGSVGVHRAVCGMRPMYASNAQLYADLKASVAVLRSMTAGM